MDRIEKEGILGYFEGNNEIKELVEKITQIADGQNAISELQNAISELLEFWEKRCSLKKITEAMKEPRDLYCFIQSCEKYKKQKESLKQQYYLENIRMQAQTLLLRYDYFIQKNAPKSNEDQSNYEIVVEKLKRYQKLLKEDQELLKATDNIEFTEGNLPTNDETDTVKKYFSEKVKYVKGFLQKSFDEKQDVEKTGIDSFVAEKDTQGNEDLANLLGALKGIYDLLPKEKKIPSIEKILDENPEKISAEEFSNKLNYFLFQNYMKDISYCGFGYTRDWEWKIDQGKDGKEGICLFRNVSDTRNEEIEAKEGIGDSGFCYVERMLTESGHHIAGEKAAGNTIRPVSYSKDFLLDIYKYVKIYSSDASKNTFLRLEVNLLAGGKVDENSVKIKKEGEVKIAFVKGATANVINTGNEKFDFYRYTGSPNPIIPNGFCIEPFYEEQYRDKNGRRLYNYQNYLQSWMGYNAPTFPQHIADKKDEEVVTSPGYFKSIDAWTNLFENGEMLEIRPENEYQLTFDMEEFLYFLYRIYLQEGGDKDSIEKKIKNMIAKQVREGLCKKEIQNTNGDGSASVSVSGYEIVIGNYQNLIRQIKKAVSEKDLEDKRAKEKLEDEIKVVTRSIAEKIGEIIYTRVTEGNSDKKTAIDNLVSSEFIRNAICKSVATYQLNGLSKKSIYKPGYNSLTEWKQIFLGKLLNLCD